MFDWRLGAIPVFDKKTATIGYDTSGFLREYAKVETGLPVNAAIVDIPRWKTYPGTRQKLHATPFLFD